MNNSQPELRAVNVTRYITPLREGGSLPAIVDADDGFMYVLKFRGAGQGLKALIAEFSAFFMISLFLIHSVSLLS